MGVIDINLRIRRLILRSGYGTGYAVKAIEIHYRLIACYLRNDIAAAPYIGGLGAVHSLAGSEAVGAIGVAGIIFGIAAVGIGLDERRGSGNDRRPLI